MSVTFAVSKVSLGKPKRSAPAQVHEAVKAVSAVDAEACGANIEHLLGTLSDGYGTVIAMNGLLHAAHSAFADHYPLILSPDDIWLAIAQGFANHVNAHAEKLRHQFVQHEDQEFIEIQRDSFVKGSPDNDWPGAFSEFSDKIAGHIGKKRNLLVSGFSTTGPIEKAASELVLMDAMKAYFTYGCKTMCGIPEVTLLGGAADWEQIRERARALSEFDCKDWINSLVGVLDHFVQAHKGSADPKFWQSFYKQGGGSGGPFVNGAINVFFPYIADYYTKKNDHPNPAAIAWDKQQSFMSGPSTDAIPLGMSKVPFVWDYYGQKLPMYFLGGFVGTSQDPETLALRPSIGWAVAERPDN